MKMYAMQSENNLTSLIMLAMQCHEEVVSGGDVDMRIPDQPLISVHLEEPVYLDDWIKNMVGQT